MNKDITVLFLSCKRFDLFSQIFKSFWENCLDKNLIESFIVIDDSSENNDRKKILELSNEIDIPSLIICKNNLKTLCRSFNLAFDICKTKYLFTIEDDWIFIEPNSFITESLEIFNKHSHVKKVIPDLSTSGKTEEFFPKEDSYITKSGTEYVIDEYRKRNQNYWASYSDRTGIIDKDDCLKYIGYYSLNPKFVHDNSKPTTETDYAMRFTNQGFKTAYFKKSLIKEISFGYSSAFDLNNINRHYGN